MTFRPPPAISVGSWWRIQKSPNFTTCCAATKTRNQLELFKIETVQEATSCLAQTVADELTLVHLLTGDLGKLDLLPVTSGEVQGDGLPDLNTDGVFYVGQSMGTVIGLPFLSLAKDIDAAVLNVPGSGIVAIVTNGEITAPLVGRQFIPRDTSPLNAHLLYVPGQSFVDYIDPINYGPQLQHNLFTDRDAEKQILLQQSQNDGLIPNWATDIMARSMGIPVIEPYVYLPYGFSSVPSPVAGSGVYQYNFTSNSLFSHILLLLEPESRVQMVEYLKSCHETGRAMIYNPYNLP